MATTPRKKQPEQVRMKLLGATAEIASQYGIDAVTTAEVAKRAGVTSGGLFHHFSSKKQLIDELINVFLDSLEAHIEELAENDHDPRGRFCRAYLLGCQSFKHPLFDESLLEALYIVMNRDPELTNRWLVWFDKQLEKYGQEKDPILGAIIRYAADGICMEDFAMTSVDHEKRQAVVDTLVEWTRRL